MLPLERRCGKEQGNLSPKDAAREAFRAAISNYEALVVESEIVRECYLGRKLGFRTAYIWNILTEDFTSEQMQQDPRFAECSEDAAVTIAQTHGYRALRVANLNPSSAEAVIKKYQQNGVEISRTRLREGDTQASLSEDTLMHGEKTDILIGGQKSADVTLEEAHTLATRVRQIYGDTPEEIAEIELALHINKLDRIKDKSAAEMLKNITYARNASVPGFAGTFELMAEPDRVLNEIVYNIYDPELISSISEIDVRSAIESGTLKTNFKKVDSSLK